MCVHLCPEGLWTALSQRPSTKSLSTISKPHNDINEILRKITSHYLNHADLTMRLRIRNRHKYTLVFYVTYLLDRYDNWETVSREFNLSIQQSNISVKYDFA